MAGIFPKLDIFLTRKIITYIDPAIRWSVVANLNKAAHSACYDCSVLQTIVYGKEEQKLTYDAKDYLDAFIKTLARKEQLRKLDVHYYYTGDPFPSEILPELQKFQNLEDLRLPESRVTQKELNRLDKCRFEKCLHFRMPLVDTLEQGLKLVKSLPNIFPKLESLHFEDINTDNSSFTEKCSAEIVKLNLKKFRMRLHEDSSADTMKQIIQEVVPGLQKLYLNSLSVNKDAHSEILTKIMEAGTKINELVIINESPVQKYECNFSNDKLRDIFIDRLTSNYESLTAWLEKNQELEYFQMKYPYRAVEPHEPAAFNLSFLPKLISLNICGVFSEVNLEKLPLLTTLRVKFHLTKFKLVARSGSTLELKSCHIKALPETRLQLYALEVNQANVHSMMMLGMENEVPLDMPNLFKLETSNANLVNTLITTGHKYLRDLRYIYPKEVPEYLEEFLPKLEGAFPFLAKLSIDLRGNETKSVGQLEFKLPQVINLQIMCCKMLDEKLVITNKATNLETLDLVDGEKKEVFIEAPNIKHIALRFLKRCKGIHILPKTRYTLHLRSTDFQIHDTPGMSRLFVQFQTPTEDIMEFKKKNFYEDLEYIQFEGLTRYSHKFFNSLIHTAPNLKEMIIDFYNWVTFDDDTDKRLNVCHPGVEFVTLRRGEYFFPTVEISPDCKNLKTLKFRDFDFKEFKNTGGKRFWSEKNLLNDNHFE